MTTLGSVGPVCHPVVLPDLTDVLRKEIGLDIKTEPTMLILIQRWKPQHSTYKEEFNILGHYIWLWPPTADCHFYISVCIHVKQIIHNLLFKLPVEVLGVFFNLGQIQASCFYLLTVFMLS